MEEFDIVVLGGGSGSQIATAAAEYDLEAAVIEPGPLGGACITRGCVPSKALLHRADIVDEVRHAERFGVDAGLSGVDYAEITSTIHDAVYGKADRQEQSLNDAENVTLYRGEGRFVDERTIEIDPNDGEADPGRIRGEHVVVAVGGRPVVPPIDGLDDVDYLTSEDALFLDERPDELVIVGGGYIGAELGYFFAALGTEVSIVGRSDRLVPGEDDDVSEVVTDGLATYCDLYTSYEAAEVGTNSEDGDRIAVTAESVGDDEDGDGESDGDDRVELSADELLIAAGRRPNTDTLDLGAAGVETDDKGHVEVDGRLETTAENVWALGDVLAAQPFKHAADYESEIVAANILDDSEAPRASNSRAAKPRDAGREVDYGAMPHAIFTSPQVASVGATESELDEADEEYESTIVPYDAAPKGLILKADDGFVKVLAGPDGEILGCHIVGPDASTLIHEVVVAMARGEGTVDDVAETVHVHPALNEVVLKAFDEAADRPYSTAPDWRDVSGE
ncbi:dihydrolipoyl dehydrogenase [Halosolutus gelatinilyticus]|uniref:dihydrolipoyl dehydrogenase n=1 Tax=Halosolutus gelatinilyticus TaxID=2931975 RepID=UPI001FF494D9|nr:dihydrolipoyl dehydrogenase [Halosolutus gelatinilyticus]